MNNCIYLKHKLNRTFYCKEKNKIINLNECSNCELRNFKPIKSTNTLKNITFRLTTQQKQRFSIIYHNLSICAYCGSKNNVQKNEVYEGAKRGVSMQHGFIVPLCDPCHKKFHKNREFALKYKKMFQSKYEETHSHEDFMKLIHHNYI